MKEYRQTSFYTLTGVTNVIELGDHTFGEWIVYENAVPKYHINMFDQSTASNILIGSLLSNKQETIDSIIRKINIKHATKLSFGKRPIVELVRKSEIVNLELVPLPESWIKNID